MFNVCPNCGLYHADKIIDPKGPDAVCPSCSHPHRFVHLPLFLLIGASGSGKTTLSLELSRRLQSVVVMESDILWRDEFNRPESGYNAYREVWLRVCKNISQAGRPVLLCGTGIPEQFEGCVERRYFTVLRYLALVCSDEELAGRLKRRPAWRGTSGADYIREHVAYNRWLKENAARTDPPITLFDTSDKGVEETTDEALLWIEQASQGVALT